MNSTQNFVFCCFFLFCQDLNTALHLATMAGKREVVQVLLNSGANPTVENKVSCFVMIAMDTQWHVASCVYRSTMYTPLCDV